MLLACCFFVPVGCIVIAMIDEIYNRPAMIIARALERGMLAHAYLFSGENRESLRREVNGAVTAVLCAGKGGNRPCGECAHCGKVGRGSHPDLAVLDVDGPLIKVEHVREFRASMSFSPLEAERRVFVIHECERMNREAANALLKTLEEPPPGICIIMSTLSVASLLPTIVSRCQVVRAGSRSGPVNPYVLAEEGLCSHADSELLMVFSAGDADVARELCLHGLPDIRRLLFEFISGGVPMNLFFRLSEMMARDASVLRASVTLFETLARDILLVQTGGGGKYLVNMDFEKEIRAIASCYGFYSIEDYLDDMRNILYLSGRNVNRRMLAERMLVFWVRKRNGR
jgi:DNA polymerase-3 subunit delta'